MTKKDNRAKISRIRSAEYQRRKKVDLTIFWCSVFLNMGVPLIWYGATEFDLVHPIQNSDFKSAVGMASAFSFLILLWYVPRAWHYFDDQKLIIEPTDEPADPSSSTAS